MKLLTVLLVGILTAALADLRFPLVVLVVQHSKTDPTFSSESCRGTALDDHRILTVASCVDRWSEDVEVLIGTSVCKAPDQPVDHVVLHPFYNPDLKTKSTANVAILFVNESLQVDGSFQAPNLPGSSEKTSGSAFLDTTPGWQQVPILQENVCRSQTSNNTTLVPSTCNITLGSTLLQSGLSRTTLIGMVTSIPDQCPSRCPLELTSLGSFSHWANHPKLRPPPPSRASVQLPEVPASVIFSFLKLLAVIGSLGGVSFVFCCVMFLISS
ncbi:uncharacterized protein LOC120416168 [Culex pipiens pallens]|uniref:uncharacterized protein LOC120416168 n=1 Tax=Culex pipiens pallens TaxID=42434 RepID=UPI001954AA16|nr:uncharacterized protein LOC120416168 [Culex pipiens pallens]